MDRKLHKKVRLTERGEEELEGDANRVTISFDPETGAKVYQYYEDLKLPWMDQESILTAGQKLYALVRARNANEFVQFGRKDLMAMLRLVQTHGEKNLYAVLVPRDFLETPQWFQDQFRSALDSFGTHLLVCPEFVDTFDVDAAGRLDRSRRLRNDLPAELSEIREITRPRSTEFTMVTLPRVAGLQYVNLDVRKLLRWSESLLRDIAAGSNPEIVRSRYNRVRDRIEFAALGLLHSGEYSVRAATFGADCLDQLVQAANETPSQGTTLTSSPNVQERQRFLDQSAREGSSVVEILDVCGPTSPEGSSVPLDDHQLQQAFRRLQARDTRAVRVKIPGNLTLLGRRSLVEAAARS